MIAPQTWRWTGCLVVICGQCLAAAPPQPAPPLTAKARGPFKEGHKLSVSTEEGRTVITVHSKRGIGRAEISPTGDKWPAHVVLRLHLRGLESLRLSAGGLTIRAEVPSSAPHRQLCEVSKGDTRAESVQQDSPFWLPVQILNPNAPGARAIPLTEGYFEVTLPEKLLSSNPSSLSMQWIDFFRN